MLQACLNGGRTPGDHPAVPVTPAQLGADAAAVAALGVTSVHVHPRAPDGTETLAPQHIAVSVGAIRAAAPGIAVGVSTGAWIAADRLALVARWREPLPDFASVNVHEPGWSRLCEVLHDLGVGVELGVFHVQAADRLRAAGLPPGVLRVLAEVQTPDPAEPARLLAALSFAAVPVLLHGERDRAWPVLAEAARRGLDTRIGLEDTLTLPDGTPAAGNADLVAAAG